MDQSFLTYQKFPTENKLFIFHGTAPILEKKNHRGVLLSLSSKAKRFYPR